MNASLSEHAAVDSIVNAEEASIAAALREEADAALQEAVIPTAEVAWLRAQLRARGDAAQLAARPVAMVQALGVACAIGAAAGVVGTLAWWLRAWAAWLSSAAALITTADSSFQIAGLASRGIFLALAVWLVIAPVAVYLAATEE